MIGSDLAPVDYGLSGDLMAALAADEQLALVDSLIEEVVAGPSLGAMEALGRLGDPAALPALDVRCFHPEPLLASAARRAVVRLRGEESDVEALVELLGELGGDPLRATVELLTELEGEAAWAGLLASVGVSDPRARGAALDELAIRLDLPERCCAAPAPLARLRLLLATPLETVWPQASVAAVRIVRGVRAGELATSRLAGAEPSAALRAWSGALADGGVSPAAWAALQGEERAWAEAELLAKAAMIDPAALEFIASAGLTGMAPALLEIVEWPDLPGPWRMRVTDALDELESA